MANITVTYTFTNGTTADATEVNTNFTDIINGTSDGSKDFSINALTCAGTATLNGAVNLGNATSDDITITGYIASSILPKTTASQALGSTSQAWSSLHLDTAATDGGAVYFNAGTTAFLKSDASGGNLAIGGFTSLRIPDGSAAAPSIYSSTGTSDTGIFMDTADEIGFSTAGSERVTIDANGYVGIGDVTPAAKLEVVNSAAVTGLGVTTSSNATSAGHFIQSGAAPTGEVVLIDTYKANSGSANFNYIHIRSDSDGTPQTEFRIAETGQIVVNSANWGTGGTAIGISSNVMTTSPSSLRYKENVKEMREEIDSSKIYNLRPVTFDYKNDKRHSFGFIAEEVEKELPCLVHKEMHDGELVPESVSYDHLSILLLEEIKTLRKRIEDLESK